MKWKLIYRIFFIYVNLILIVQTSYSQDIHFSQFYAAPLYLSPSFTGSVNGSRIITNFRDQWPEISRAFVNQALSYDKYFPGLGSGIGILLTRDQKGALGYHTSSVGLLYAYDIRINHRIHFKPGLEFQYAFSGLDKDKMITRDMIQLKTSSPMDKVERERSSYFDAKFSVLFYNNQIWIGSTVAHLMRPVTTIGKKEKLPLKFNIYSGVKIINKGKLIKPKDESLFIACNYYQMSRFNQMIIGLMGNKGFINAGLWYRGIPILKKNPGSDAIIISVGYENPTYKIGISYDITTSGLNKYTNGAIEVSLSYIIPPSDVGKKKPAIIPCPGF